MISIHASREGCDLSFQQFYSRQGNFNPRIPRGMRRCRPCKMMDSTIISIHASREGCDKRTGFRKTCCKISIHASREGCDGFDLSEGAEAAIFQSTHPARDATPVIRLISSPSLYFNPRIPRGMRRTISVKRQWARIFQSTHPARDATPLMV